MSDNDNRTCLIFILIVVVLLVIYSAVGFLGPSNVIPPIIDFFQGVGLCVGATILFFICFYIFEKFSTNHKNRFEQQSQSYSIQLEVIKMENFNQLGPIPDDLSEESSHRASCHLLGNFALTNYGLWISKNMKLREDKSDEVKSNWQDYVNNYLDNSIIPLNRMKLNFVHIRRKGYLDVELGPSKANRYTDEKLKLQKGDQLKIIVIFTHIVKRTNLQKVIQLERPVKLKLNVLKDGNDDPLTTAKLYREINSKIKSNETDEDDSWMYQSRPRHW